MNVLDKYKAGLGVIGGFTLMLLIIGLVQAGGTRQDNLTYKKATEIADKLNDYTLDKNAPESLSEVGFSDVPETISYEKLSDTSYKFCMTYKKKATSFSGTGVWADILYGGDSYYSGSADDGESSYLYIDSRHDKGENCQTISFTSYDDNYYDDLYHSQYDNLNQD